jgi:predicted nuclease with RNAse H fold
MSDGSIVVGIDIAARRPSLAVAMKAGRSAQVVGWMEADSQHEGETARLLDWIEALAPAVVAVDAPQAPNRHLLRDSRLRVCDWELRRRGLSLYQVPARGEKAPGWIAVGFDFFKQLKRRGLESPGESALPLAFGQAPALLEVYPYATFVALLREAQRGGGRAASSPARRPPGAKAGEVRAQAPALAKKASREGTRIRVELLRDARVEWSDYYDDDSLDALAAGLTAWRHLQGKATGLGDSREGLVWLPLTRESLDELLPPR